MANNGFRILCLASLVSILFVGCGEPDRKQHARPQPVTLDSLCDEVQRLSKEGRQSEIANVLTTANVQQLVESELARPDSPRFVVLAEDALVFPGVSVQAEHQILDRRSFLELPGFGDDATEGWGRDAELYDAAEKFASLYNSKLYEKVRNTFDKPKTLKSSAEGSDVEANKKAQQVYESIRSAAAEHLRKMGPGRGSRLVLSDLESPPGTIVHDLDDSLYFADEWQIDLQRGLMQKVYFPESDEVHHVEILFDAKSPSKIVDVNITVDLVDLESR